MHFSRARHVGKGGSAAHLEALGRHSHSRLEELRVERQAGILLDVLWPPRHQHLGPLPAIGRSPTGVVCVCVSVCVQRRLQPACSIAWLRTSCCSGTSRRPAQGVRGHATEPIRPFAAAPAHLTSSRARSSASSCPATRGKLRALAASTCTENCWEEQREVVSLLAGREETEAIRLLGGGQTLLAAPGTWPAQWHVAGAQGEHR